MIWDKLIVHWAGLVLQVLVPGLQRMPPAGLGSGGRLRAADAGSGDHSADANRIREAMVPKCWPAGCTVTRLARVCCTCYVASCTR